MKEGGLILIVILVGVIGLLGYYNFQQHDTIELLNEEILEQARLRHNLILEKHVLENDLRAIKTDSLIVNQ